jgi:hypothetical protein
VKDGLDLVPAIEADSVVEGRDLFDGVDGGAIGGGRVGLVRSERLGDSLSKRSKKALLEFAQVKGRLSKKTVSRFVHYESPLVACTDYGTSLHGC